MILTDPPYGVAYAEKADFYRDVVGAPLSNDTIIQGDGIQSEEQYTEFTKKWLGLAVKHLVDYNTIYIFNADTMLCSIRKALKGVGVYYSQILIWVKNTVFPGRKDYLAQHELIAYGWYGKHKRERVQSHSVLFFPKPSKSKLHPTMKPVGLLRKLILNSTKTEEIIYDPFGGSGSTLIAAEELKRKCAMIEISPIYIQTIIDRWERLTGGKAVKIK